MIALEEVGVPYQHTPLFCNGDAPEDRAILNRLNPNSHVPVIEDEGLVLWESMAINLYLAEAFGGSLWPAERRGRALVYQWSLWVQTEMDRPDWNAIRRSGEASAILELKKKKAEVLGVLDRALAAAPYLLGDEFSFADLNVAASLSQPNEGGKIDWQRLDPGELGLPSLARWLEACTRRDSWRRVADLP